MSQIIFLAVENALDDLLDKCSGSFLIQVLESSHVLEKVTAFEVFHDDDHFHIFHG